jgi:hypothetical protein
VCHRALCFVLFSREGKFHVLQEEPDMAADALDAGALAFMGMQPMPPTMNMNMSMGGYSLSRDSGYTGGVQPGEFSASELDSLKAQLEALLPVTPSDVDEDDVAGC